MRLNDLRTLRASDSMLMKHTLYVTAAFAAGALAMYYLDSTAGRRRRARVKDAMARVAPGRPAGDVQLRERVRARMGHLVSHPRAIEVEVDDGTVRLSGQILAHELDGLLTRLTGLAGVRRVVNALSTVSDATGFGQARPADAGDAEPADSYLTH